MQTSIQRNSSVSLRGWLAGVILASVGFSLPAMAVLGGDASSVQIDQSHMKASIEVKQPSGAEYSVHEMKSTGKLVVREFVSSDGRVFGVSWQGTYVPDLQQLLGTYFQQYTAAVKEAKAKYVARRPLNIQKPGLVVQTSGHMMAYWGRAYDPSLVPSGVNANDIR
jgi:hypothetical protein